MKWFWRDIAYRKFVTSVALLSTLFTRAAHADTRLSEADLIGLLPKGSQAGIVVQPGQGKPLWHRQADTLMLPASTMKLFTVTASWLKLGPEFHFTTTLAGEVRGTRVSNLTLVLSGDPTLDRQSLRDLLGQLRQQGVKQVKGDIHLVSPFSGYHRAKGWPWDDLGICFATAVSPYLLDRGCAWVPVKATKQGEPRVEVPSILPLTISADLVAGEPSPWCPLEMDRLGSNRYHLRGCVKAPMTLQIAIDDQKGYLESQIGTLLKQHRIGFDGDFVDGKPGSGLPTVLARHDSEPLPELVRTVLLDSNNQVADALFRTLSLEATMMPGSFDASGRMVKRLLAEELQLDMSYAEVADGSGLSRYNLVSPNHLVELLQHWQSDPRLQPLKAWLPVAGISGTLRYRSGVSGVRGLLRAKTGSFGQVANIAGLVTVKDGSEWVVVQLINGLADRPGKKQKVADFESALYGCLVSECQRVSE